MQKFAVKIDLSTFFDDERKNVLILADPEWEDVEKLQQRVEKIFEVQNLRFLSNEGYFLPPQEPIEVIKFVSVLKAFIPAEVLEEKKRKKMSKKSKVQDGIVSGDEREHMPPPQSDNAAEHMPPPQSDNAAEHMPPPQHDNAVLAQKKRKYCSLLNANGFVSSTPNQAKRTKSAAIYSPIAERELVVVNNKSSEITSTNDQLGAINESKAAGAIIKPPILDAPLEKPEIRPQLTNDHSGKQKQRKRTQKQKRRETAENIENISMAHSEQNLSGSNAVITVGAPSSTFLTESQTSQIMDKHSSTANLFKLHKNQQQSQKHIYYSDSDEASAKKNTTERTQQENVDQVPKEKVNFCCTLSQVDMNKPRIFALTPKLKPKKSVHIQEIVFINPIESHVTKEQTETEVKECKENIESFIAYADAEKVPPQSRKITVNTNVSAMENKGAEAGEKEKHSDCNRSSIIAVDSIEQHDENESEADTETTNVIDLNETEESAITSHDNSRGKTLLNDTSKHEFNTYEELTVKKILPFCSVLNQLPDIGDIVVFKMFRLNDACAPGISNLIAGRCEYTNKRTKNIKLYIIDGQAEIGRLPAKFACNLDDSSETKYINVKLTELIDAKVFKMS